METGCPRVVGRVFDGKLQDALRNVVWSFLRIPEELVIAMGGGRPEEHLLAMETEDGASAAVVSHPAVPPPSVPREFTGRHAKLVACAVNSERKACLLYTSPSPRDS